MKHFENRCLERVGCILSQKKLKEEMNASYEGRQSSLGWLGKQSRTKTFWKLHREERDYVIVYDKLRHCFVTVMHYDTWIKMPRKLK